MEPLTIMAIAGVVSALAPVVGDLVGRALGSGDKEEADRLLAEASAQYNVQLPTVDQLAAQVAPSAAAQAKADPEAVEAQRMALQNLGRMAEDGGGIEYRAGIERARRDVGRDAAAQDASLQQQMRARGLGGSGLEYATRAIAGQGATDREAAMGFDAAAGARQQALQALQGEGALASQMRSESFGEARDRGNAADEINKFNAIQRSGAFRDLNGMQLGWANARAGNAANRANVKTGQAAQTQQQWGNYGLGVGQTAATLGQSYLQHQQHQDDNDLFRQWLKTQQPKPGGA